MKAINKRYYDEGCKIWEARTYKELKEFEEEMRHVHFLTDYDGYHWDESDWWEYFMEVVADSAYSCDGYRAKNIDEAYFVICEAMTVEEANEWLAERIDEEEMLGAVA